MKRSLLIAIICLLGLSVNGQVKKIDLEGLKQRVTNVDTVYVINFWATWCKPCIAELPYFEKLQAEYKGQPMKVLLVSMDFESKLPAVKAFALTHKLNAEVLLAIRQSDQDFIDGIDKNWSGALPGTLIVNSKKGIRKFHEQEFTYEELNKLYQTNK